MAETPEAIIREICDHARAGYGKDVKHYVQRLRASFRPMDRDGTTHWAGCYTTLGHHACALAEIERLKRTH